MYKIVGLVLFSVCSTTVFARNDTILHGWHSESHQRGTWSILWGCLATIFICTWSVLHLEVPPRSKNDLWRFHYKVQGTLLAIVAPEYFLADAINTTLTSCILIKNIAHDVSRQQGREAWSLSHVRFMLARGFAKDSESDKVWDPLEEIFNIPQEPKISKKELKSRSTTDWIANTLALFQISWFGAQLLVRRVQHLHITAIEILTLAFIICSIFTFILCWPQPQNVAYPVVLLEDIPPERSATNPPKAPLNTAGAPDKSNEVEERDSNFGHDLESVGLTSYLSLAFAGSVFGAVHCLAWNSTFPTPKERLAWRVCSVATTALPIIAVSTALITEKWTGRTNNIEWAFSIPYIAARLTLIALALASLRAVPADVFQTTDWNNIVPHVGL